MEAFLSSSILFFMLEIEALRTCMLKPFLSLPSSFYDMILDKRLGLSSNSCPLPCVTESDLLDESLTIVLAVAYLPKVI